MKRLVLCAALLLMAGQGEAIDLLQAYQRALENDPQLREARLRLEAARESRPEARAALLPNVSLSANGSLVRQDITGSLSGQSGVDSFGRGDLGVAASLPLYRRDRTLRLEQTDHTIVGAEADFEAARLDLIARTAAAYFDVLAARDDLRVSESEVEANKRQLEQAQQRFEVGLIAITDVHEARAVFDAARAREIQARNAVDNAFEALYEIIGPSSDTLAPLGERLPLEGPDPAAPAVWTGEAMSRSPALISAAAAVEAQRKTIEIERAGDDVTIDLVGSHSFARTAADSGSDSDTTSVGLQLALPLYTGGGVDARVRRALADLGAAEERLEQQRRAVTRDVRDAYRGLISTISQVEALEAATLSAQSALESTQAGYQVGTRTIVDVLNVQRNLFDSQRNLARARYDYILSRLQLRRAAATLSREDLERINAWLEP